MKLRHEKIIKHLYMLIRALANLSFIFLFSEIGFASQTNEDSDIPSLGRSSFDHLVQKFNEKLPSFNELIEYLKTVEGVDVVRTQLAHGRSLVRHETDFNSPRDLIAIRTKNNNQPIISPQELINAFKPGYLFIGYSPTTNSAEVISYNPSLGRLEFQIAENFGSESRVYYAPRKLCKGCHQDEKPIFPQAPWDESEQLEKNKAQLESGRYWEIESNKIEGFVNQRAYGARGFDNIVRSHTYTGENFNRIWNLVDSSNHKDAILLKKLLLKLIIYNSVKKTKFSDLDISKDLTELKRLFSLYWPSAGLEIYLTELENRKVVGKQALKTLPVNLDPLSLRKPEIIKFSLEKGFFSDNFARGQFDVLEYLKRFVEVIGARELEFIFKKSGQNLNRLFEIVESEVMNSIFNSTALNVRQLYKLFATELNLKISDIELNEWERREALMAPPELYTDDKNELYEKAPQFKDLDTKRTDLQVSQLTEEEIKNKLSPNLFKHLSLFCSACHRGKGNEEFNFMKGTSEEIQNRILNNKKILTNIFARLNTNQEQFLMPPPQTQLGQNFRSNKKIQAELLSELKKIIEVSSSNLKFRCANLFKSN